MGRLDQAMETSPSPDIRKLEQKIFFLLMLHPCCFVWGPCPRSLHSGTHLTLPEQSPSWMMLTIVAMIKKALEALIKYFGSEMTYITSAYISLVRTTGLVQR